MNSTNSFMERFSTIWEWTTRSWESLTWGGIAVGSVLVLISVVVSYAVVVLVMVKIPADYFSPHYSSDLMNSKSPLIRWGAVILKNLMGVLLILLGVVMTVGPGPGLLTILIGLIMLDIPGKRPLEAKIIRKPAILSAVNSLRARYNKSPLIMD
ncbi:MAG TPA: hypothetical protein VNI84_14475 [Pyrinomonadaceae bacterium]|nr:hypothetical protein [Pyrinomonadaceae bacterium]